MASPIRPDDWERLFAVNAPRRGGPLAALGYMLIACFVLGAVAAAAIYFFSVRAASDARFYATATAFARDVAPGLTATAAAPTATPVPAATVAPTPTVAVVTQPILRGGNMRSAPRVVNETLLGLLWPGDTVQMLEGLDSEGTSWFRVRVVSAAADRPAAGVAPGTEGWIAIVLLSPP